MTQPSGPDAAAEPPGLQVERTLLAWNRTLLAVAVTLALVVRVIGPPYPRLAHLPALVIAGVLVWLWVRSDLGYRTALPRVGATRDLVVLWACALFVGLGGVVAIIG